MVVYYLGMTDRDTIKRFMQSEELALLCAVIIIPILVISASALLETQAKAKTSECGTHD